MKKILAVIDMQKDFVDGSLGTKEAVSVVPSVIKEIENSAYDQVFATMDTHEENYLSTQEGKYLPVEHCIRGSEGWKLVPEVDQALRQRNAQIIEKPVFGSFDLAARIAAAKPDEVVLVGLCTDICVVSNAMILRSLLYETTITVLKDACAGVTPEKHEAALEVMNSCQIQIR